MSEWMERWIEPNIQIDESRKRFSNHQLRRMMIPLFIEQLLLMVVGLADTMMVSHAGEATVSGVSLDTMIYTIFILIFSSLGAGGGVIVAQYIGRKDRENGNTAASQVFLVSFSISIVLMIFLHDYFDYKL